MNNKELNKILDKVNNITPEDRKVGILLNNLGLTFRAGGRVFYDNHENEIGEIDLIFTDEEEETIFLVEVSKKNKNSSNKVNSFFSKWSDKDNIKLLKKELFLVHKNIYRIYFDWSSKDEEESRTSSKYILKEKSNFILNKDDFNYFENAYNSIGIWAKNDFYNFLEIEPNDIHTEIPAIGFFIGEVRAFVFADNVNNILKYSYVYRRRKNSVGYQRMVEEKRINSIVRTIQESKTITFPNSIILNSNKKLTELEFSEDRPKALKIKIPKTFCNFRIIDGQHRLMGFSKLGEFKRHGYFLPIVIFENIDASKEVETFIEINHKQKKLDTNLILLLKSDTIWDVNKNEVEYFESLSVKIAEKLDKRSELKNNIYFGYAGEKKGKKITVATLHSLIKRNNFTGTKSPLFQKSYEDIETPYLKIKEVLSLVGKYFKKKKDFFISNTGLRILFRFIQIFERNRLIGNININLEDAIKDLNKLFTTTDLETDIKLYGEGGALDATERIVVALQKYSPKYENLINDLRSLKL